MNRKTHLSLITAIILIVAAVQSISSSRYELPQAVIGSSRNSYVVQGGSDISRIQHSNHEEGMP